MTSLERLKDFLSPLLHGSKQTKQVAALAAALFVVVLLIIIVLFRGGDDKETLAAADRQEEVAPKVTEVTERASIVASAEVVERLAEIERALGEKDFRPSDAPSITSLKGASLCDEGAAFGLSLTICVYESGSTAAAARAKVERADSQATSVALVNDDALLWIVDESAADPEGRRIQELVEVFRAIE